MKKLLNNNYFVLALSFVIAFISWAFITVEKTPETTVTLRDIPVSIDYTGLKNRLNLTPFDETDYTVSVTVTGKRYLVDSDDIKDKISVTADVSGVTHPGRTELYLDAQISGDRESFKIEAMSRNTVSVYFDYAKDVEFTIEPELRRGGELVPEGYIMGTPEVLDGKTIRVSGPESEVNKITGLKAMASFNGEPTETQTITTAITPVSTDSPNMTYIKFYRGQGKTEINTVKVSVPVYKKVTLPAEVNITGKPAGYSEFSYTISPASITIGVPQSRADSIKSLEVKTIDFTTVTPGTQEIKIKAKDIDAKGLLILDENLEFTVKLYANNTVAMDVAAPTTVECINIPGNRADITAVPVFTSLRVMGPAEVLNDLTTEDFDLSADVSGVDFDKAGTYEVPVTLNSDNCWLYGAYSATVTVK